MIIYSQHAKEMLQLRKIRQELADQCANNPDQVLPGQNNRKIYLKDFGVNFLKLVVLEEDHNIVIITAHWLAKRRVKQ